jgi:hypothetical protein
MPQAADWTAEMVEAAHAGGASNLLCPGCQGGKSRERSMTVFPSGLQMVAKCWRASCTYRSTLDGFAAPRVQQGPPLRPYEGELHTISACAAYTLYHAFGVASETVDHFGLRETIYQGVPCIAYPVLSADGARRGWHLRELDKDYGKMRRLFREQHGPAQGFFVHSAPRDHVLVEDPLSALRLWQLGYTSCMLIGTHISDDRVSEQQQLRLGAWKLALDADAFGIACKYSRQYTRLQPVRLVRDFKDCTNAEIEERLR